MQKHTPLPVVASQIIQTLPCVWRGNTCGQLLTVLAFKVNTLAGWGFRAREGRRIQMPADNSAQAFLEFFSLLELPLELIFEHQKEVSSSSS